MVHVYVYCLVVSILDKNLLGVGGLSSNHTGKGFRDGAFRQGFGHSENIQCNCLT